MHTESFPSPKLSGELDVCSASNNISVLEEDLALSSSTLGPQDKSTQDQNEVTSSSLYNSEASLVYVNEDTMDCSYSEASIVTPKKLQEASNEISSPEMFESDEEEEEEDDKKLPNYRRTLSASRREKSSPAHSSLAIENRIEPTTEELISKSDCYLLARINKFLTGVPPPPKHTICQSDCADLLSLIRANRDYFYFDPLSSRDEKETRIEDAARTDDEKVTEATEVDEEATRGAERTVHDPPCARTFNNHRGKSSLRNLTNAFDACERYDDPTNLKAETTRDIPPENLDLRSTSFRSRADEKTVENDENEVANCLKATRHVTFKTPEKELARIYSSVGVEEVKSMTWEQAYRHKTHGIHYNRSKAVEDFESLTLKLCQRYIGAETQSTCNIWFTKQTPGSVKKRNLLGRRNNGQSPGKRLSHLARRRRTFSSANLQVLGMVDKKQLVLNIKKPTIRKGKSPRGKSPRGKSPRGKSPRGSAKKRGALSRISPSPRKTKLETSKRALFQSPPGDRAGPSHGTSLVNANSQQRIKRALFSNPKTELPSAPSNVADIKRVLTFEESKKRKSEDDLEGPRYKWAKSLSFDCAHLTESNSSDSWSTERHSTGNFHIKAETSMQQGKIELSDTHRKKLLWAVAEALRGKGISMGHPRFKQCASQLARIVKKYMPDLENPKVPRKPGSTSDRMLRLAKRHVLLIVESKSAE